LQFNFSKHSRFVTIALIFSDKFRAEIWLPFPKAKSIFQFQLRNNYQMMSLKKKLGKKHQEID